ncbi:MAG TPA: hypothetical protein VH595_19805 [Verrucomicrobiae bacterium]|jgi:hypothetical protein|nr:hypothetical protein [Verrucomicrobiae bacterium]
MLAVGVVTSASAFSLWGPAETWQTQDLDYGIRYLPFIPITDATIFDVLGRGDLGGADYVELGGTKDLGDGARQDTPVITYAFDSTFLNFFGTQGVAAVNSAFAIFNALPKASTANLAKFLTQGNEQINYTAQALRMLDIKSTVMWIIAEHLGLIGETHTYDLRERTPELSTQNAGSCGFDYTVLQRNYDPVTYDVSDYVNGTLLTYQIGDLCPGLAVGDAMEQSLNPGLPPFSAVATKEGLQVGGYYLGITRDDMGGLKYLYRHNRYVNEGLDTNALVSMSLTSAWAPVGTNEIIGSSGIANFAGLLGGVEKVTFVQTPYQSLYTTNYTPRTYKYAINAVINGALRTVNVARTVSAPDIIFTAGDLVEPGPDNFEIAVERNNPSGNFITSGQATSPGGLVDPNVITPVVLSPGLIIVLNDDGPIYYNTSFIGGSGFLDQGNSIEQGFIWGSFNGTTNAPIAFPNGTSIEGLEAQVLNSGLTTTLSSPYSPVGIITNGTSTTGSATQ